MPNQRLLTLLRAAEQSAAAQSELNSHFNKMQQMFAEAAQTIYRENNNIAHGILPGQKKATAAKKGKIASAAETAWSYVPPVRKSARLQAQKNRVQLAKVAEARKKRAAFKKMYNKNAINMLTAQRRNKEISERNALGKQLQTRLNSQAANPNNMQLRRQVGNLRRRINLKNRVIEELNYNLKFNASKGGFIQRLLR